MIQRIFASCCALGLTWIAGCSIDVGDPEPPPDLPADPPADQPPSDQPPSDQPPSDSPSDPPSPPSSLPPPPPSLGTNVPGDAYDPANHRLLIPDCKNDALVSVDLFTGERSVFIDEWPWTQPVDDTCVLDVVIEQTGERAFATVLSAYPRPEREGQCVAIDLVAIDTETRVVTPLQNIDTRCCDDFCGERDYFGLQVDDAQQRLLHVETDCGDYCSHDLATAPFSPGESQPLHPVSNCPPYEEIDCSPYDTWMFVRDMKFDPAAPDERLLLLTQYPLEYRIESLDIATGTITHVVDLQSVPEGMWFADISVDVEKQRVLVAGMENSSLPNLPWMVIAVDLVTHEQSVLYHDSPAANGSALTCSVTAAFDSRARRLLLSETQAHYTQQNCSDRVFAMDPDTGELTLLGNGPAH